jgi:hypothetical protein
MNRNITWTKVKDPVEWDEMYISVHFKYNLYTNWYDYTTKVFS